mmetsp:Transcript_114315/g.295992  ORF Transcript_114315/g.295992 Transcript_114315/m.295992 type:complete len:214 (+) Transcript_114315:442-1083(+)
MLHSPPDLIHMVQRIIVPLGDDALPSVHVEGVHCGQRQVFLQRRLAAGLFVIDTLRQKHPRHSDLEIIVHFFHLVRHRIGDEDAIARLLNQLVIIRISQFVLHNQVHAVGLQVYPICPGIVQRILSLELVPPSPLYILFMIEGVQEKPALCPSEQTIHVPFFVVVELRPGTSSPHPQVGLEHVCHPIMPRLMRVLVLGQLVGRLGSPVHHYAA